MEQPQGGSFLIKETQPGEIFIPEEFTEESQMIFDTTQDFLDSEVFPNLDRIDSQEEGLMAELLKKAGELGLLGLSVPEDYEGFEQDFVSVMRANEAMGSAYSYSVAIMAHTGIGTLPLLYYGNEDQKSRYLPKLATGELMAAYCLTEPGAGSDANSGKTRAVLSDDGKHYILNGQKMWITNGGFADLQTVFAKIDNDRVLSAFLVERSWEGVSMNPEEKKMGIKGSSTRQIFYNDVKVPAENMLGKRGEGFRIALNILHIGRIKLGATVLGSSKRAILHSVNYANERKQFGKLISEFGAIKYKLAQQVIRTFTAESAVYRASKDIDNAISNLKTQAKSHGFANIEGTAAFAIECALMKVLGSEALDYIVDEAVQIYGGMGFSSETPVDRAYRDSRINRIFEGTNEINRLLAAELLIKKAKKPGFDLAAQAAKAFENLYIAEEIKAEHSLDNYYPVIKNFKQIILAVIHLMLTRPETVLTEEEEVMMNLSDMMMPLYALESTWLRLKKLQPQKSAGQFSLYEDILGVYATDAAQTIRKSAHDALKSLLPASDGRTMLDAVDQLSKVPYVNVKEAHRRIAGKLIEDNDYRF